MSSSILKPGSLDPTFGNKGIALPTNPDDPNGFISGLTITPEGKFLVTGRFGWKYAIICLNPDGSPHTGFGKNGVVTGVFENGVLSSAGSASVLSDGRILVTGIFEETEHSPSLPAAARYYPDGKLDTTFGYGGTAVIRLPLDGPPPGTPNTVKNEGNVSSGVSSTIMQDGSFWLVSKHQYSFDRSVGVLSKHHSDSTLDTSFNNGHGYTIVRHPEYSTNINTHLIQPDGKFIFAGTAYVDGRSVALTSRFLTDGNSDEAFGNSGFVLEKSFNPPTQILSVALQNGNVTGVGSTLETPMAGLIQNLSPDGSHNPAFNEGKTKITPIDQNAYGSQWKDTTTDADRNILVAGNTLGGEEADVLIGRYRPDGKSDDSFGEENGILRIKVGPSIDIATAIALQRDGRIVVAGFFHTPDGFRPFIARIFN
ncbi:MULTISPECIES: hypothetical protein [Pseudomonas]|uniref:hypothetical protein n=1 Tax=Pseudomonas TaxID=286 RepID=UPI001F3F9E0B|nr:hypothetical protein [Pseudomonas sputi]